MRGAAVSILPVPERVWATRALSNIERLAPSKRYRALAHPSLLVVVRVGATVTVTHPSVVDAKGSHRSLSSATVRRSGGRTE